MDSQKNNTNDYPLCPCGGETEYFGEALMGSLTCKKCHIILMGVGWNFIKTIKDRWIRGDRGYFKYDVDGEKEEL